MNCTDIKRWLPEYVDGEANPMQVRMLENHLRECKACQQRLASLRGTDRALRSLEPVPVPEGFTANVLSRLPRDAFARQVRPWYRRQMVWYRVAAAVLVLFVLFGAAEALLPEPAGRPLVIAQGDTAPLVRENRVVRVPEGQTFEGDLTVVGGTLVIAGTITGNVRVVRAQLVTTETADIRGNIFQSDSGAAQLVYSLRAAWSDFIESMRMR